MAENSVTSEITSGLSPSETASFALETSSNTSSVLPDGGGPESQSRNKDELGLADIRFLAIAGLIVLGTAIGAQVLVKNPNIAPHWARLTQGAAQLYTHITQNSDIAQHVEEGVVGAAQGAVKAGEAAKVIGGNLATNSVNGGAEFVDDAQGKVLGGKAVQVEASVDALKQRDPDLLLPPSMENSPQGPYDVVAIYQPVYPGITDMAQLVVGTDQIAAVQMANQVTGVTSGELSQGVFALLQAQRIGSELGVDSGGQGLARITPEEVADIVEELQRSGTIQLLQMLKLPGDEKAAVKELVTRLGDPNVNFALARIRSAFVRREIVEVLKEQELTVSAQTQEGLAAMETLEPGAAERIIKRYKDRSEGNIPDSLAPDLTRLLKYTSGNVADKQITAALLVSMRAQQDLAIKFNLKKSQLPAGQPGTAIRFPAYYDQLIREMVVGEFRRQKGLDWDLNFQIPWEAEATQRIEQLAEYAVN